MKEPEAKERINTHPIWGIARLIVLLIGAYFILRGNATNFDITELKSILYLVILQGGAEGGIRAIKKGLTGNG